jgi:hypothetical protein
MVGDSNARAAPMTNTVARIHSRARNPIAVPMVRKAAAIPATAWAAAIMRLRSCRSGEMAGHQHQQERRYELHQPDQAEVERIAGQRVHLPADRDRLHVQRDSGGKARDQEPDEQPLTQQRGGDGFGHWLRNGRLATPIPVRPVLALRATTGSLRVAVRLASRSPKGEGWWSRGDLNP